MFVWFVCLVFNGTSIQEGQFVPIAGGWNRLGRLRMANDTQCIILQMLHSYNVTQFTVKCSSYKTATRKNKAFQLHISQEKRTHKIQRDSKYAVNVNQSKSRENKSLSNPLRICLHWLANTDLFTYLKFTTAPVTNMITNFISIYNSKQSYE